MFEKEIKLISDYSFSKIKKLGAYFTVKQLNSTDLHPSIKRYIDSELEYLIFLDRKELVQKSAFDYSKPEVVKYFNLITSEIKNNKKISFEDAKNLIIQAVSFTANFLVRPKWSLTKFIYNEDQLKSIDEISLSLNYLYYYDYLRSVLKTYLEKKHSLNFSLIDFEVALNKIDKELFAAHSQKLIDNALFSIADFFSMSGIYSKKISPNCVELFLKEKDLIDHLFRLRRSLPVNARQYYYINDIRRIIYTPTNLSKSEFLPSRTDKEEEPEPEKIKPVESKVDKPLPKPKTEDKEEVVQEEMFEFDKETGKDSVDKKPEEVQEGENETLEEQSEATKQKSDVPEEESKTPEEPNEISEKEVSEGQKEVSEEVVNETEESNNPKEVNEEDSNNEIDSLLEEKLLSEFSSEDELLDAFDSQLKALEEESDMLMSDDENSPTEEDSKSQEDEGQPDDVDRVAGEKEQPKIELETKEQNKLEDQNTGDENIILEEEVEESGIEKLEADEPTDKINKEEKKSSRRAPQRARDLFSFLSNKEIEKIVISVFNEDREDFANTMEKITECFTYDEATDILKAVFFSYRVNPYVRDAVTLTNAVSNYFDQAT